MTGLCPRVLLLALALSICPFTAFCGKLTPTTAEVSFYSGLNKLKTAHFEYFVKANNVQYGARFGVDLYKVFPPCPF